MSVCNLGSLVKLPADVLGYLCSPEFCFEHVRNFLFLLLGVFILEERKGWDVTPTWLILSESTAMKIHKLRRRKKASLAMKKS